MPAQTVTVTKAESGQKLLQYLERRLNGEVPRSAIQKWIRTGQVRVDGGRKKPFDRIEAGQKVRIPPHGNDHASGTDNPQKPGTAPARPPLDIIYSDDEILAVAKPAGLPAHGGTGHVDSVVARLGAMFPNADFAPTLVHRLDKATSGILLAARTYKALRRYNDRMASSGLSKRYLVWVAGSWPHENEIEMRDRLEKTGLQGSEKVAAGSGKVALAKVRALHIRTDASLLLVELLTGRTHQIRAQLSARAFPIIGDPKYGGPPHSPMLLHAYSLALDKKKLTLRPNWPKPFAVKERMLLD